MGSLNLILLTNVTDVRICFVCNEMSKETKIELVQRLFAGFFLLDIPENEDQTSLIW